MIRKFPCQRAQFRWVMFKCLYLWHALVRQVHLKILNWTIYYKIIQLPIYYHCVTILGKLYVLHVFWLLFTPKWQSLHISLDTNILLVSDLIFFHFASYLFPLSCKFLLVAITLSIYILGFSKLYFQAWGQITACESRSTRSSGSIWVVLIMKDFLQWKEALRGL